MTRGMFLIGLVATLPLACGGGEGADDSAGSASESGAAGAVAVSMSRPRQNPALAAAEAGAGGSSADETNDHPLAGSAGSADDAPEPSAGSAPIGGSSAGRDGAPIAGSGGSGGATAGGCGGSGQAGSSTVQGGAAGSMPQAGASGAGPDPCVCSTGQCCDGCRFRTSSYLLGQWIKSSYCSGYEGGTQANPFYLYDLIADYWNVFCTGDSATGYRWGAHIKMVDSLCPNDAPKCVNPMTTPDSATCVAK